VSHSRVVRRRHLILGLLLVLTAGLLGPASAQAKLVLKKAGSFNKPIYVTSPPGPADVSRLIVVQRGGTIKVVKNGVVEPEPFLKVPEVEMDLAAESGLFSIAFHPDYATNGLFYVAYTKECGRVIGSVDSGCPMRVDEYRASTRNRADPASRRKVIQIPHPDTPYHYGGQLQFGPDGYLYISSGEGGHAPNGQRKDVLLGKMLRIDPTRSLDGRPYSIPPGNPFVGVAGRDEIWAYGLRNPWRFSFDRETGDMVIGDVGQNGWEEVNHQEAGTTGVANYGWSLCQGPVCKPPEAPPPDYVAPAFAYEHPSGDDASSADAEGARVVRHPVDAGDTDCRAITGGYVSRDLTVPETYGKYVYGDYCVGDISLITFPEFDKDQNRATDLNPGHQSLVSFGEDARCHVYAVSADGTLWRIASTREPLDGRESAQTGCGAVPAP